MKITDEKLDQMLHNEENPAFDQTFEFKGKKEKINTINKRTFIRVLASSLVFIMLAAAVFAVLRPKDNGLPTVPADTAKLGGSDGDPSTERASEGGEPDQYPPERPDTQKIEPVNGIVQAHLVAFSFPVFFPVAFNVESRAVILDLNDVFETGD